MLPDHGQQSSNGRPGGAPPGRATDCVPAASERAAGNTGNAYCIRARDDGAD